MSEAMLLAETSLPASVAAASAAAALAWMVTAWFGRLPRKLTGAVVGRARHGPDPSALPWPLRVAAALVAPLVPAGRCLDPRVAWLQGLAIVLRRAGIDGEVSPLVWCLLPIPWLIATALVAVATPWPLAVFLSFGMMALGVPWIWLRQACLRRESAVLRELPLHLDLLALSLESGATLLLALRTTLPRSPPGPLHEALVGLWRDLQAGRARTEAIQALQRRVDFECVQPLTTAMIQAERSGAGLAQLLRTQSEQRSHERFHRAEQLAMQAPVKMLGPLVLCIFPGTFIVLAFVVLARMNG